MAFQMKSRCLAEPPNCLLQSHFHGIPTQYLVLGYYQLYAVHSAYHGAWCSCPFLCPKRLQYFSFPFCALWSNCSKNVCNAHRRRQVGKGGGKTGSILGRNWSFGPSALLVLDYPVLLDIAHWLPDHTGAISFSFKESGIRNQSSSWLDGIFLNWEVI